MEEYTTIRVSKATRRKIKILEAELDMDSHEELISFLLSKYEKCKKKEAKKP